MHTYNRELSWLAFNDRVLQEAQDEDVPLIQRLRFLGIYSNNQDEFIKVRVANLMRIGRIRTEKTIRTPEGFPAKEILTEVHNKIDESQQVFSQTYGKILSEMEKKGICLINEKQLTQRQKTFCHDYFSRIISPRIVPLIIRKSTKLPFLSDQFIYQAIKMSSAGSGHARYAIIPLPVTEECPRFVELPSRKGKKELIFLDDIIRLCLNDIFFMFNYETISAHTFKLIRDAILTIDDDISKSLFEKMEESLEGRKHGEPVRLVVDKEMPEDLLELLSGKFRLKKLNVQVGGRYHMLRHLMDFPVVDPSLEYESFPPLPHPYINRFESLLKEIRKQDIFLHYPYHSFTHVIDFLREAAIDPKVCRIFITLYRTARHSQVINVLINAAENGKEVIVMEELMARFDEEQNIENSELMQKAGIKVVHGVKGLKVHSKLIYVERKEKKTLQGYAYIGTGNFNESTARIYSDFAILTAQSPLVEDIKHVFDYLLNPHKPILYKQLLVSPVNMRSRFESLIEQEIRNKKKGKEAYIYAKCNSLTDIPMVRLLYKASRAGVDVRLIIRGACCICPQVADESEHIRAISIVDKYLEHARLFIFYNDGKEETFIGSADWMTRNLDNRIEVITPVTDEEIKKVLQDVFIIQWSDNVKARDLAKLGENRYVQNNLGFPCRSQTELYHFYQVNNPPKGMLYDYEKKYIKKFTGQTGEKT